MAGEKDIPYHYTVYPEVSPESAKWEPSTEHEYFGTSKADMYDRQAQERRLLCNESIHIFTLNKKPLTSSI